MGPRLSKYNLFLVDRYLEDKDYSRSKEELHPAWIKDRDHLFLILEVKETSGRELHMCRKIPQGSEKGGAPDYSSSCQLPRDPFARIHPG